MPKAIYRGYNSIARGPPRREWNEKSWAAKYQKLNKNSWWRNISCTGLMKDMYGNSIHGTGIFTHMKTIKNQPNVGKYTSPMDSMGMEISKGNPPVN